MAEEPAPAEVEVSEWGLPINWDGHETRQYIFFVTAIEDIAPEGWEYVYKASNTGWVICPQRSEHAPDYIRQPVRPHEGRNW